MKDRTPFSGRVVWLFHRHYIENRKLSGTDSEESFSQPVLRHLEDKGIVGGFQHAWQEFKQLATVELEEDYPGTPESEKRIILYLAVCTGALQFLLISLGIDLYDIDHKGHWKFLSGIPDRRE